ncbi:MAG TPA: NUDIX domain-containing protein, partial [Flavitalea sp.]|nr:NUDIX domain-containing protein [Flavitalea sp.]
MKKSAGILMYRRHKKIIEVFLVHPGGPFWKNKDEGAWSIPKGEYEASEDPLKAAIREFEEETGSSPAGGFLLLSAIRLKSGKQVIAWAVEGEIDPATIV